MTRKTFISLVVLIGIFVYAKSLPPQEGEVKEASHMNKDESPTTEPTPTPSPITTQTPEPMSSTFQNPTSTPKPVANNAQGLSISAFFYPGATQVGVEDKSIILETTDNPDTVTEWYKSKMRSLSMSAKSFVQTSTNGRILNKLAGDNGTTEVNVEITKRANSPITRIAIAIESP